MNKISQNGAAWNKLESNIDKLLNWKIKKIIWPSNILEQESSR